MDLLSLKLTVLMAASFVATACAQQPSYGGHDPSRVESEMSYLDNGEIRFGIDLRLGGAITYLADARTQENVVNSHDWGRQIQMSFYGGPQPFAPNGKKPSPHWESLGWNPIQSGDFFRNRSRVLQHRNDGKNLYVKSIPMHWPLDNQPAECTFECWFSLDGRTVRARCRFVNARSDTTQYPARHQELPAVYVNAPYYRLMTYDGSRPFTGDKLTFIDKRWKGNPEDLDGPPWANWLATENWAALVNENGWGLGIWTRDAWRYNGGFFGDPGIGGSADEPTGYLCPNHREILDHNIVYEYEYVLLLDDLDAIRRYACDRQRRPAPPDYRFHEDRQHWRYEDCYDAGWPIKGKLDVRLNGPHPKLIGPESFWQAADAPKLCIRAAYQTNACHARIRWARFGSDGFDEDDCVDFAIEPDGAMHTYTIDLSAASTYEGPMRQLRFDPIANANGGDDQRVQVELITFR